MDTFFYLFGLLLFGHALADMALQPGWMSREKRRVNAPDRWYIVLSGHAVIHGGFVLVFLGSPLLGLFEAIAHFIIDFGRCEGCYGIKVDQGLHVLCKVLWVGFLVVGIY